MLRLGETLLTGRVVGFTFDMFDSIDIFESMDFLFAHLILLLRMVMYTAVLVGSIYSIRRRPPLAAEHPVLC